MLQRAISSVLAQTHSDLSLLVINDDPDDGAVESIVESFQDTRCKLFRPVEKRGATKNFDLVFRDKHTDFVALLEDDNWWEPTFLESQMEVLRKFPETPLVVGNERIWRELPDRSWLDTDTTIWPFRDVRLHRFSLEGICGSATICNSSMLVRSQRANTLASPLTIPVDVTEHFRERLLPTTIPLNGAPLVNYAETLSTARDVGTSWAMYQSLLIGSCFAALPTVKMRHQLAQRLWSQVSATSPRSTSLVCAGISIAEARPLLARAPFLALARTAATLLRRPRRLAALQRVRRDKSDEFEFLLKAPLTRALADGYR